MTALPIHKSIEADDCEPANGDTPNPKVQASPRPLIQTLLFCLNLCWASLLAALPQVSAHADPTTPSYNIGVQTMMNYVKKEGRIAPGPDLPPPFQQVTSVCQGELQLITTRNNPDTLAAIAFNSVDFLQGCQSEGARLMRRR